ncbi:MAG: ABC transporter substrate-binding protein [Rhodobacteraceae bacterium]|nr:ABC transporter substrate-binding protein [Paracoccaceae bacterium]
MRSEFFKIVTSTLAGITLLLSVNSAVAESAHGIAMYGDPALPPDYTSLPYAYADAPKGGRVVFGNTGGFDTLNPFVQKGTAPWQLRFWGYESLMGRSWDEPFSIYGLLAETIETPEDRSWVEFTLRPEARFSDGSPVTVEDVIWSYETLGTVGHLRYRGFWSKVDSITQTGPHKVRINFNTEDRELALLAGLRPILKKSQWTGKSFADSGPNEAPIGTGAYVINASDPGRYVSLARDPDYWGKDLPFRRGTQNFDQMRIEFFGDATVLFEAFKVGELTAVREYNAGKWDNNYNFPSVQRGDVVKSEIPHQRPSGITGLAMNTRNPLFADWRVREALIHAFNFEYINGTVTGGTQPRITSYYSNSALGMRSGPAEGAVRSLLEPYASDLLPGALDGYQLPVSDGTERNRRNLRSATKLLSDSGWSVQNGVLQNAQGEPFEFSVLLRQGDREMQTVVEIYARALDRLGIKVSTDTVDNAQYVARQNEYDFDMTRFRRDLSLSPGNEQYLYWGRDGVSQTGSRNLMGINSPVVEALIPEMLNATSAEHFISAVRALDRVLTTGRYVIPIWQYDKGRIAHAKELHFPDTLPIYGDRPQFMPTVWWYDPN